MVNLMKQQISRLVIFIVISQARTVHTHKLHSLTQWIKSAFNPFKRFLYLLLFCLHFPLCTHTLAGRPTYRHRLLAAQFKVKGMAHIDANEQGCIECNTIPSRNEQRTPAPAPCRIIIIFYQRELQWINRRYNVRYFVLHNLQFLRNTSQMCDMVENIRF